jgi:hypothetical protein
MSHNSYEIVFFQEDFPIYLKISQEEEDHLDCGLRMF